MKHLAALGAVARPEYVARIGTRTIIALRDTGNSLQEFRVPEAAGRKIHDAGLRNEREFLGSAGYFVEKTAPDARRCASVQPLGHHPDGQYAICLKDDLLPPMRIQQLFPIKRKHLADQFAKSGIGTRLNVGI